MDYGEILSRAWNVISKHKILWLFGVLASCGTGQQSSSFNFSFPSPDVTTFDDFQDFGRIIPEESLPLIIGMICAFFILAIVFFIIGVIGRVSLIKGTLQVEAGAESLSFGQLFKDSQPYLARALGLNLLVILAGIAIVVVFIVVVIPLTLVTVGLIWLCLIPLFCLLIPVSFYLGIVLEQANIAILAEDLGIMDALKRGWNVARENLGSVIVMGLILILGGGILTFIISIPSIFILFPIIRGFLIGEESSFQGWLLIAGICLVVYIPIFVFLNGILQSYIKSAWTLTFLRLTGNSSDDSGEPLPAAA